MSNDGGSTPVIIAETGGAGGFIGVFKPHEERHHARHPGSLNKGKLRRGSARPAPVPQASQPHESLLRPDSFSDIVNREIRRSERSSAPLSVIRYVIDDDIDSRHFERLLAVLQGSMRETDILGHLGTHTLAILCPDTNATGARGLLAKLAPLVADLPLLPTTATFPDHIFESLSGGTAPGGAIQLFNAPAESADNLGHYSLKRALDIVLATIALIAFAPLMLVIALLVRLTSRGPVIFRQTRLGKGGTPFTFFKFRSMAVDGDDRIHREFVAKLIRAGQGEAGGDAESDGYKMKADPRVTRIGKIIRMTSIDELPQLFNVLKGDMSMVGPRPPIPYEAAHYDPWQLRRILIAKPGITGIWQVEGRSRVTFSEMVRMDLRYIRQCSLALDLKLLLQTVGVVLRCSGAR